ncbi:MAG: helix-turn-helix transcriptional regulator [Methylocystaceae bacterium]|nr:helix-turn-helix transcriptional regulator [Methylocystaceae bacterium]
MDGVVLPTTHDIVIFRGTHQFNQDITGPDFQFGNVKGLFEQDTFMVSTAIGGWARQEEKFPQCTITFGDRLTYFRNAREYDFESTLQASANLCVVSLSIPINSMALLIGEESTKNLLRFLNVSADPSIAVHEIPMRITQILQSAVNPRLTGSMKRLYCQSKSLEYLCELVELMEKSEAQTLHVEEKNSIIQDIHNDLVNHPGRLPTLTEIAQNYGMSARSLNTLFTQEFGLTINQCITRSRMEKAHELIQNSDIALKLIADKFGYSHVNHFITAFKREFGYTPGSLRK